MRFAFSSDIGDKRGIGKRKVGMGIPLILAAIAVAYQSCGVLTTIAEQNSAPKDAYNAR